MFSEIHQDLLLLHLISLVLESDDDPSMLSRNDLAPFACVTGISCAVPEAPFSLTLGCLASFFGSKCHGLYCALNLECFVSRQELTFLNLGSRAAAIRTVFGDSG